MIRTQSPQRNFIALLSIHVAVRLANPSAYAKYESDQKGCAGDCVACRRYHSSPTRAWLVRNSSRRETCLDAGALSAGRLRDGGGCSCLQRDGSVDCLRS